MASSAGVRLLLFAHGSRDPRWRAPFETLERTLRAELGEERVRLAYMEFVGPTLPDAAAEAVRDGVATLLVLPLFLSAGAHVAHDIPAQAEEARRRHPTLNLDVLPPIGEDPRFVTLMKAVSREALENR
ncbi:MAG TPA: CbiX/SirB N-terminal domain-containing protein [Candidatus Eisenbacteria bacterium]|nr:CbiX/SirB N-terminal domain-containing protein [Candidatus Eisenbacteria bacterium]